MFTGEKITTCSSSIHHYGKPLDFVKTNLVLACRCSTPPWHRTGKGKQKRKSIRGIEQERDERRGHKGKRNEGESNEGERNKESSWKKRSSNREGPAPGQKSSSTACCTGPTSGGSTRSETAKASGERRSIS